MSNTRKISSLCGLLAALLFAGQAQASTIQITVDTTNISGVIGSLAFDLIPGGFPPNSVSIFGFTTDGTLGAVLPASGDVKGTLPGTLSDPVTIVDSTGFNEYAQGITFGHLFSFFFNTSGGAGSPPTPAGFSLFILDADGGLPIVSTSDPTGADSLFLYSIGQDVTPDVFTSESVRTTARVLSVPEPGALALVIAGLLALGGMLRAGSKLPLTQDRLSL
jgi:hypothetical protein